LSKSIEIKKGKIIMSVQTTTVRTSSGGGFAFLNNLRIGPKIIVGYLFLIFLIGGVTGVAYWGINRIIAANESALERAGEATSLWAMQVYAIDQYAKQADLVIHGHPDAVEAFRTSAELMDANKERAGKTLHSAEELQLLADIDRIDVQFDAMFFEQVVPAWEAGDRELLDTLTEQADELLTELNSKAQQIIVGSEAEMVEAREAAGEIQRQTTLLMVGASLAAAVIGLVFGLFLSRSISKPVQVVAQAAARLAEGDVDQDLPIASRDEIGEMVNAFRQMIAYQQQMAGAADRLAQGDMTADVTPQSNKDVLGNAFSRMITYQKQMAGAASRLAQGDLTANVTPQSDKDTLGNAFRQMIANLRNLIGQVQQSADQVASSQAGQQVATTIQQVAQGTTQQSQSVTEATGNVEQIARAADGIARGAQEQAKGVQKTSGLIVEMAGIVGQVGQVANSVNAANAKVTQAARHGVSAVEQTGQGMETIRARTAAAAKKVKEMGARGDHRRHRR
jgi:methyl-accepting chemotaxis protein